MPYLLITLIQGPQSSLSPGVAKQPWEAGPVGLHSAIREGKRRICGDDTPQQLLHEQVHLRSQGLDLLDAGLTHEGDGRQGVGGSGLRLDRKFGLQVSNAGLMACGRKTASLGSAQPRNCCGCRQSGMPETGPRISNCCNEQAHLICKIDGAERPGEVC